jgi:uncharacterized membrane protein YozB (DUF420 family)
MTPILVIPTIAGIALLFGAMWMRKHDRKRANLMLAAAVIMLVNVLLWMNIPPQPAP